MKLLIALLFLLLMFSSACVCVPRGYPPCPTNTANAQKKYLVKEGIITYSVLIAPFTVTPYVKITGDFAEKNFSMHFFDSGVRKIFEGSLLADSGIARIEKNSSIYTIYYTDGRAKQTDSVSCLIPEAFNIEYINWGGPFYKCTILKKKCRGFAHFDSRYTSRGEAIAFYKNITFRANGRFKDAWYAKLAATKYTEL